MTGLGYVGLTIATAFGQTQKVIGFDINPARIASLKKGHDSNGEVSDQTLKTADIDYTTNPDDLKRADFHIITVLTPVNSSRQPDFTILLEVTETIGKQLKKGDIVVYESTVYPGATQTKCIPLLEKTSNLICGKDFSVGYSPERINPSDKEHTFTNIIKIISATDEDTLNIIDEVYSSVVKAGVYRVSSIRVAEASKVIENTQRDLNISLINEIALILQSIGMDSPEVLAAARTKWNFLPFQPGLVGGHCIGVNSYYLTHVAKEAGYHPDVIQAGRRVNDYMVKFIAEQTVKKLIKKGIPVKRARVAILGVTYKENCPDMHDSRVLDLIKELELYDIEVIAHDPLADPNIAKNKFGIELHPWENFIDIDAIILAVAHKQYLEIDPKHLQTILRRHGVIMDVKSILNPKDFEETGITLWQL